MHTAGRDKSAEAERTPASMAKKTNAGSKAAPKRKADKPASDAESFSDVPPAAVAASYGRCRAM